MLRRDREKKAFLKQSFENRIEEARTSSKVELTNSTIVLQAKFERQISELKERALRDAEALHALLRAKDEEMRVAQAQFSSKLAAEKAGSKHYSDQLKSDLESTKAQLEFLRKSTASTSSAKSILESERKALSDEMARLTNVHKEERQRNEVQMHKLRSELDEIKASQAAERKKIKETTDQASKQLEAAHDQLRNMQFELQSMQQRVDVSSVRLAESEGSLKDLYGRYRESQSILSETLSSKEEHEKAALVAQDTIVELSRDKDELTALLRDSKEQIAASEGKLIELQSELESVLKAQERNRKKLSESEMKVAMLVNDLSSARSVQKELEARVAALNDEVESLTIARSATALNNSSKSSSDAQKLEDLQSEIDDARAMRELEKQGTDEIIASLKSRIAELEGMLNNAAREQGGQPSIGAASITRTFEHLAAHEHVIGLPSIVVAPADTAADRADASAERTTFKATAVTESIAVNLSQQTHSHETVPLPSQGSATHPAPVANDGIQIETSGNSGHRSSPALRAQLSNAAPVSSDSHLVNTSASGPPSSRASSTGYSLVTSRADSPPRPPASHSESTRDVLSSSQSHRLPTASVASTSSGLSVSGMSGVEAAAMFMNEAGKKMPSLLDSAPEVTFFLRLFEVSALIVLLLLFIRSSPRLVHSPLQTQQQLLIPLLVPWAGTDSTMNHRLLFQHR
jgi:chromosome segregation ATPase